jgi:hypothetical protein
LYAPWYLQAQHASFDGKGRAMIGVWVLSMRMETDALLGGGGQKRKQIKIARTRQLPPQSEKRFYRVPFLRQ